MDPQGGVGQRGWGRFEPTVGAVVDDGSRAVWSKGVGWVTADGTLRRNGQDYQLSVLPPEMQAQVLPLAEKAKRFFAPPAPPVADQMRDVQARAAAPPVQAPHPEPSHKLIADSFKHLANTLTKTGRPPGGA